MRTIRCVLIALMMAWLPAAAATAAEATDSPGQQDDTYSENEILNAAESFFGATTKGLAEVIEKAFGDLGRPNAYILGEEAGGAFFAGLRYGKGTLNRKTAPATQVYWQGPTVGFDFGGDAAKVFTLVYHLDDGEKLYRRFPGVEGSLYVVAGLGLNYNQRGSTVIAPIRTGVGLRWGLNVGYVGFTRESSLNPF